MFNLSKDTRRLVVQAVEELLAAADRVALLGTDRTDSAARQLDAAIANLRS